MAKRAKTGGRKRGTPNKVTKVAREEISSFLAKYISGSGIGDSKRQFEKDIEYMEPMERVKVIISLLPYAIPKLASMELVEERVGKSFKEELDELEDSEID